MRIMLIFQTIFCLFSSLAIAEVRLKKLFEPHDLLIKFKSQTAASLQMSRIQSMGHTHVQQAAGFSHIRISEGEDLIATMKIYEGAPDVEWVQPNYRYYKSAAPNDPSITQLWGLSNSGQSILASNGPDIPFNMGNPGSNGKDISAFAAWDHLTDCTATIVAVVDTGVNYNHQDLAPNMWNGGTTFPNHGWNFIENNNDPLDKNGHGTHVAGTIGAVGNNGIGTTGVCWKARIMAVRVLDASGSGTTAGIIKGIDFAVQNGAKVINLSLGGGNFDAAMLTSIQAARNAGVVIVAAAGNDGANNDTTATYPCNYQEPNVICVAALNQTFDLASYSNYGAANVAIGAPGTNILSSWSGQELQIKEPLSSAAGWTQLPVLGQSGAWGMTTVNLTLGGVAQAFPILANPANWNGTNNYINNTNSLAFKNFNLANQDAVSGDFSIFINTESAKDFFRIFCKPAGGDPTTGGLLVESISGLGGKTSIAFSEDLTACMGPTATVGFQITSDAANTNTGIALLPFSINTLKLNPVTYNVISGTSMAAPHVTGIVAMVQSYNPSYTMLDVVSAVKNGGVPASSLSGKTSTGKAANAMGSLSYIQSPIGVTVVK